MRAKITLSTFDRPGKWQVFILVTFMALLFSPAVYGQIGEYPRCIPETSGNDARFTEYQVIIPPGDYDVGDQVEITLTATIKINRANGVCCLIFVTDIVQDGVPTATDLLVEMGNFPSAGTFEDEHILSFDWSFGSRLEIVNAYSSWLRGTGQPCPGCPDPEDEVAFCDFYQDSNAGAYFDAGPFVLPAILVARFDADEPVCDGEAVDFTDTTTGGLEPYSYSWDFGDGNSSSLPNPSHTYDAPGFYTVTLTVTDDEGTISTFEDAVTVNPLPDLVITNPDPVCEPETVDLTHADVTDGSTLYGAALTYWEDVDATIALANPGAVSESGTYYIKAETTEGCFDIQAVEVVIEDALEAFIEEDQAICYDTAPDPLTSTVTGGGGEYSYQWWTALPDGTPIAVIDGATDDTYAPGALTETTSYVLQVSDNVCDDVITDAVTITVTDAALEAFIEEDQAICYDTAPDPLTSTVTGGGGEYSYQWWTALPDGTPIAPIDGATDDTYAPGALTETTSYVLQVSDNVCDDVITDAVTITVNPLPTIELISGSDEQTVFTNADIENIVYAIGGTYTTVSVSGEPDGVTGAYNEGEFTISGAPTEAGVFNYTVTVDGDCGEVTAEGTIEVLVPLEGIVTYYQADGNHIPMEGILIRLILDETKGHKIGTLETVTDVDGMYSFSDELVKDAVALEAVSNREHGGLSAIDALAVQVRGLQDDPRIIASYWDPDNDDLVHHTGYVSRGSFNFGVIDAFFILDRHIYSAAHNWEEFWLGDWAFYREQLMMPAGERYEAFETIDDNTGRLAFVPDGSNFDIQVRAHGDVRGTYFIQNGDKNNQSFMHIQTDDVVQVDRDEVIELPLTVAHHLEFNAMDLNILYDNRKVEVVDVLSNNPDMIFAIDEGHVKVAWADIESRKLEKGDAILTLAVRTIDSVEAGDMVFSLDAYSEFGDAGAEVIPSFELAISSLDNSTVVDVDTPSMPSFNVNVYPNPFRDNLNLSYSLDEPANVRITIMNYMGAEVAKIIDEPHAAGQHQRMYNPDQYNFKQGVYFLRIEVGEGSSSRQETLRLVYMR